MEPRQQAAHGTADDQLHNQQQCKQMVVIKKGDGRITPPTLKRGRQKERRQKRGRKIGTKKMVRGAKKIWRKKRKDSVVCATMAAASSLSSAVLISHCLLL